MNYKLCIINWFVQVSKYIFYTFYTSRTGAHTNIQSLARAIRDVFTARESSMGSSGGTTEVRISVHSRNSL